jgi:hypothetical protein
MKRSIRPLIAIRQLPAQIYGVSNNLLVDGGIIGWRRLLNNLFVDADHNLMVILFV